ncbi:MAG TPA: ATP-binding protein [Steroidobacteraceae bacterium]|nr:ATP-binding protein [Steroidobacteraceae bacterium]
MQMPLNSASRSFLRQLCNLRWLAVASQAITIAVVTGPMQVALDPAPLWAGVGALAAFNVYAWWRAARGGEAGPAEIFAHLAVDIVVLTWQVSFSGGIENPFSSLFLLPMAMSILVLPASWVWGTAALSILGYGISAALARPLPHVHGMMGDAFNLHMVGMLVNFVMSAAVILVFLARVAAAWREREREVASLRERFARNEGIIVLATHAASVAHELNTPLATLTLMTDDLAERMSGIDREELVTMQALIGQCRDRVRELAMPAASGASGLANPVNLENVIDRWLLVRPAIELRRSGSATGRELVNPAAGHLLLALLNNAADAGEQTGTRTVELALDVDGNTLSGHIRDYGRGFKQTVPLLPGTLFRTSKPDGLGIGLALSHATVESLGGELSMREAPGGRGITVSFRLPGTVKS